MSNIVIFDTESTDLYATWGRLLCFTWMNLEDKKPHIIKISDSPDFKKDCTNDRYVVKEALKVLNKADMIFGWYSKKHDIPLINSRALYHGLETVPPIAHVDGWMLSKYQLKMPRNSLLTVSGFFNLQEKTPIKSEMWSRARAGYKDGLEYVYAHGLQDVVVTRDVYYRLRPLMHNHPNVNIIDGKADGCGVCGSKKIQSRGPRYTSTKKYMRFSCQECGLWSSGKAERRVK